ncbi:hypothetical protein [Vibrio phage vB_VhaP_PG11]|nr:hypothetical protein [Vibrio phage vB_VhaP_PG11]
MSKLTYLKAVLDKNPEGGTYCEYAIKDTLVGGNLLLCVSLLPPGYEPLITRCTCCPFDSAKNYEDVLKLLE